MTAAAATVGLLVGLAVGMMIGCVMTHDIEEERRHEKKDGFGD